MTGNDNAAGDQPGGASDGRSTALVRGNIPCRCGTVRRCHVPTCLESATNVDAVTDRAYCEVHAADAFRRPMWAWLAANYPTERWGSPVGQYRFLYFRAGHVRRDVIRAPYAISESTFRVGQVVCDRCHVEDFGVEIDLCRNCLRSARLAVDELDAAYPALTGRKLEEWKTELRERHEALGRPRPAQRLERVGSAGAK
jgi:hypothetical protein